MEWPNTTALDDPMQVLWWMPTSDDDWSCIYKQGLRSTVMSHAESRDGLSSTLLHQFLAVSVWFYKILNIFEPVSVLVHPKVGKNQTEPDL